jgi:hypothetical protein
MENCWRTFIKYFWTFEIKKYSCLFISCYDCACTSFFLPNLFLPWRNSPYWARAASSSRLHDLTQTHHTRYDCSRWVISPTQRPLPDKKQHSKKTDIHAAAGFEPTIRAIEQPHTHALDRAVSWDRLLLPNNQSKCLFRFFAVDFEIFCGQILTTYHIASRYQ